MNQEGGHWCEIERLSLKVMLRSFFLETLWNYDKFQNVGFVFCLYPVLKWLYPDSSEVKSAAWRHLESVNTHPSMGPLLVGLTARLERDAGPVAVMVYRRRVMTTLAAHGDRIFWGHVKPMAALSGVLLTLGFAGSVAGSIAALIVYNIPNLYVRVTGFPKGWRKGLEVLESLRSPVMEGGLRGLRRIMSLGLGLTAGLLTSGAVRAADLGGSLVTGIVAAIGVMAVFAVGMALLKKKVAVTAVVYTVVMMAVALFCMIEAGLTF